MRIDPTDGSTTSDLRHLVVLHPVVPFRPHTAIRVYCVSMDCENLVQVIKELPTIIQISRCSINCCVQSVRVIRQNTYFYFLIWKFVSRAVDSDCRHQQALTQSYFDSKASFRSHIHVQCCSRGSDSTSIFTLALSSESHLSSQSKPCQLS